MAVTVVHAGETLPETLDGSVYLCGPTPARRVDDWRGEAIALVRDLCHRRSPDVGIVMLYPEPRAGTLGFDEHVKWEEQALGMADVVAFYVPRSMPHLPGLISNVKFGRVADSGRAVLGSPVGAEQNDYLIRLATDLRVPVRQTLRATMEVVVERIGAGLRRRGPLSCLPASVASDPRLDQLLRIGGWPSREPRECRCHFTRLGYEDDAPLEWRVEVRWSGGDGDVTRAVGAAVLDGLEVVTASR